MPLMMLLVAVLTTAMMTITYIPLKNAKKLERKNGAFSSTTGTFSDIRGRSSEFVTINYSTEKRLEDLESVETALIRTCRSVSTLAHDNGCANWNKASNIWGFAGGIGGVTSLDAVVTGTSQTTFSCSGVADFARGLFQQNVPANFVVGQGYYFDSTGMNDSGVDPCGYINIVRF